MARPTTRFTETTTAPSTIAPSTRALTLSPLGVHNVGYCIQLRKRARQLACKHAGLTQGKQAASTQGTARKREFPHGGNPLCRHPQPPCERTNAQARAAEAPPRTG
eukprot:6756207-Alexandrium_andersonii.AAC.1